MRWISLNTQLLSARRSTEIGHTPAVVELGHDELMSKLFKFELLGYVGVTYEPSLSTYDSFG